jgi:hypothetical protein
MTPENKDAEGFASKKKAFETCVANKTGNDWMPVAVDSILAILSVLIKYVSSTTI